MMEDIRCVWPCALGSCWSLLHTDNFMVDAIMSVSCTDCESIIPEKVLSTDRGHRDAHSALAHIQIDMGIEFYSLVSVLINSI